jgi:hypothetical protein
MRADRVRQATNVFAFIVTLVMNALANILPLNGQTTGEISNRFPVLFVPANYAFSIWSVIYLGLFGFVVYQALPSQRANPRLRRIGYLFALSCLFNIGWLLLWHYEFFVLTVVAMSTLLLTLVAIYIALRMDGTPNSTAERWLVWVPFSLYLGWITVATIVNIVTVLYQQGWNGWGISTEAWTIVLLGVGVMIAALFSRHKPDIALVGVLIWAFAAIAVKQSDTPVVAVAAGVAVVIIVVLLVIGIVRGGPRGQLLGAAQK